MADNDEKLQQFITVTGVDEERARFYLESSAWQLEVALASFYENDGEIEQPPTPNPVEVGDSPPSEQSPTSPEQVKPKPRSKITNSRFATIHTVHSSSEDEEEGQAFYAGGSEHSGQQVLGPPRHRDMVSDMFKAVREHGVEILEPAATGAHTSAFTGTGYKLGQTGNDSETIPGARSSSRPEEVTLKLWRDGFSLNDGDLRQYTDPQQTEFLDSIRRGEIPPELRQGNSEVHLSMEDRRTETFKQEIEKRTKVFSGQGHTLGSPTPAVIGAPPLQEKDSALNETKAKEKLSVDTSQPTTNIQIRLADGTRLVAQFNHMHTVGHIRSFIINARPQYGLNPFALLSSYPSRDLGDSETIAEAGLLNAAIMQKLK
ncbi:hypothetical protein PPYR_00468 [Photinus pyralis]|uniref:Uncharacterized protein n=1 Tax=Photinus pyralis TaxID=7054 RepID=A0A1Y1L4L0_PHOPY|nr:NSFL1 cofactor p47 [Photinus pyralis]XP_031328815.1 NSFL1 cofactor p47 [Photinus pyralis]KAB0803498.1 hypothetical protein PPYR_00468 [Photinus pyralis]